MTKTVLITGARGGIGRATALALAKRGFRVLATVHQEASVDELLSYAKKHRVKLEVFKLDITDLLDVQRAGELPIDILINNAAIGESGSLAEIPIDRVRDNFETNVFATLKLTQAILPQMIQRDSGRIIFISSMAGRVPMAWWGSYSMTKYALSAAADILRQEIRLITKGVHVCVVEPGTYHTGFNQRVMATKYEWLNKLSYFKTIQEQLTSREMRLFSLMELKSCRSIVSQIIKAVSDRDPKLRYTSPCWQALGVSMLRIFGK